MPQMISLSETLRPDELQDDHRLELVEEEEEEADLSLRNSSLCKCAPPTLRRTSVHCVKSLRLTSDCEFTISERHLWAIGDELALLGELLWILPNR